jgi:hypothetical protein
MAPNGDPPETAKPATLKCPKCGSELPLQKYKQLIELGVDGARDTCPVCGTLLLISFDEMTARETS